MLYKGSWLLVNVAVYISAYSENPSAVKGARRAKRHVEMCAWPAQAAAADLADDDDDK